MKKTSLKQLINEMQDLKKTKIFNNSFKAIDDCIDLAYANLEIEKEQIIEAGNSCALKQHLHNDRINKMTESEIRQFAKEEHLTFGEKYYNETYTQIYE